MGEGVCPTPFWIQTPLRQNPPDVDPPGSSPNLADPPSRQTPFLWTEGMTHACENITFRNYSCGREQIHHSEVFPTSDPWQTVTPCFPGNYAQINKLAKPKFITNKTTGQLVKFDNRKHNHIIAQEVGGARKVIHEFYPVMGDECFNNATEQRQHPPFYVIIVSVWETHPGMVDFTDSFQPNIQSGRHFDSTDLIFEQPLPAMSKHCHKLFSNVKIFSY